MIIIFYDKNELLLLFCLYNFKEINSLALPTLFTLFFVDMIGKFSSL